MHLEIFNPASGDLIKQLPADHTDTLLTKFGALKANQPSWAATDLMDRVDVLTQFCELLKTYQEQLAETLTTETGKPRWQAINEINGAIARITWLCEHAPKYLEKEVMTQAPGLTEQISYEPLGVVGNISAWNYPYLVGVNVFVPALLAGNAVLYKPSEFASLTGLEITKLLWRAGIPENIFQPAIGGAAVGKDILNLDLNGYFFTGSYATGKWIHEQVASKLVPCQLELGGKDPVYVCDDVADVASVAASVADGAFYNNGQSCCSVERIYVHASIYDEFVAAFVNQVQSWSVGDPRVADTYFGPLTRGAHLEVLANQVTDAVAKGASVGTGGKRINRPGNYFEPTVLLDVNHTMTVMREETFGPVIGIMKVDDDDAALTLIQDTDYGLTAGVYSASEQRARALLRHINSGSVYWNCCDRVTPALPWSGRKHSGIGATLSHAGLRAFTQPKGWHLRHP